MSPRCTHTQNDRARATLVGGFTIVELLVSVGIFALITSTILARNSKFDDAVLLQSAVYDVALSIRTAQNFGINVKGFEGDFDAPFGVYFHNDSPVYELFRDGDGDKRPTEVAGEILETYQLGRGFSVEKVCAFNDTTLDCTDTQADGVSILFERPDPEAIIYIVDDESGVDGNPIATAVIELASPRGEQRFIAVQQTGQIGVLKAGSVGGSELEVITGSGGGGGNEPVDGVCASPPHGGAYVSAPTPACDAGTPSSLSGSGPWYWTCLGQNGGNDSSQCSADKTVVNANGACGSANGGTYTDAQMNALGSATLCASSYGNTTPSGVTSSWSWQCNASGNGTPATCLANRQTSGQCGAAVNQTWGSTQPNANLCVESAASTVTKAGPNWKWSCTGYSNGSSVNCQAQ